MEYERGSNWINHSGHRGKRRHCRVRWPFNCEDPRILMYIDDNNCSQGNTAADTGAVVKRQEDKQHDSSRIRARIDDDSGDSQRRDWRRGDDLEHDPAETDSGVSHQENHHHDNAWGREGEEEEEQDEEPDHPLPKEDNENYGWDQGYEDKDINPAYSWIQYHVHEIQGMLEIGRAKDAPHTHRFSTVSSESKPWGNKNHYHEVKLRTDFCEDHYHECFARTGKAVRVGDRHVHFLESVTTENDGHVHKFRASAMIDDPIGNWTL